MEHLVDQVGQIGLGELGHHVGVHPSRNLGALDDLVGGGEAEEGFDLLGQARGGLVIVLLGGLDGPVEETLRLGTQFVAGEVPLQREDLDLVEGGELFANRPELTVEGAHGGLVDPRVQAELVREDLNQLVGRRGGSSGEVHDHRVHKVHPIDHGHEDGTEAITWSAVGVEVDGNLDLPLQGGDHRTGDLRGDETGHVLDGDHVSAHPLQLLRLVDEVLHGEQGPEETLSGEEPLHLLGKGEVRVHGEADRAIREPLVGLHETDGGIHVRQVVEGVEDPHDVDSRLKGVLVEPFDDLVGVRVVTEEVLPPGEGGQLGNVPDSALDLGEAVPGVLLQKPHGGIGNRSSPDLHGVEPGLLVKWKDPVHLVLVHPGGELGLLPIPQGQITNQQFSGHGALSL